MAGKEGGDDDDEGTSSESGSSTSDAMYTVLFDNAIADEFPTTLAALADLSVSISPIFRLKVTLST
jgi:hypothetical protein